MMKTEILNYIGGLPDLLMTRMPDFMIPQNPAPYDQYLQSLDFYAQGGWDPETRPFITLPEQAPRAQTVSSRPFEQGLVEEIAYPSRYEPRNPATAAGFQRRHANLSAYLHLWRHHRESGRPLVLCLHGFMMDHPARALRMFRIRRLFQLGLDVGLLVMPHHGKRRQGRTLILNPADAPMTIESLAQAVHDLHSALMLLREQGCERVGIIGASLGGYIAALYAAASPMVDFIFLVVPAISFARVMRPRDSRFSFKVDERIRAKTDQALQVVAPLDYHPRLVPARMAVVMHMGDKLCEPHLTRELVRKWGIPNCVEVPGGHWLHFDWKARGAAWYGWLEKMGYLGSV